MTKLADYLMWVGNQYYRTTEGFIAEAESLGCCKRLGTIPGDLVLNESRIFLCHDEGVKGQGKVFGFFVATSVDLILADPEKIKKYESLKGELGIHAVPAGEAALEPERGCGHRLIGAVYVVSNPEEWEKLFEMTKPITDKVEVKGGIVVFKNYLPYSGARFRGYKKITEGMIPPLDELVIAKITYHTEASKIKVRPFFIE
jgi:hypothetical protein